uniref:heparan sulfate glucosamine 3-O-sulfotransferase 4-like isoform X1 n=1 Tax=Styela clava TaxID=7725 RepID=UPI00193974C2|nr:heparan sulfate glucosamine 3-O-sulfotransferase 4-like isoform X1 [Styela clava]XP_039251024.1 heparan sulfate glucosamine 3-O-sulfotransferase 4-like isoform X1 [Styela clava]
MRLTKAALITSTCLLILFMYITNVFKTDEWKKDVKVRGNIQKNLEKQKQLQKRLPQVIGIGVKKCGTGALRSFLRHHPSIKLPKMIEPHFFDNNSAFNKGREFYRSMMPITNENETTMEITPKYYVTEWVPGRIRKLYEENYKTLKFIVILCNPIDRLYSEYVHTKAASQVASQKYYLESQIGKYESVSHLAENLLHKVSSKLREIGDITGPQKNPTFEKFIHDNYEVSFITNGIYAFHMQRWLRYFSSDQILVVNGEDLIKEPWTVMKHIQTFLGIERLLTKESFKFDAKKGFYCIGRCLGRGKGRTRSLTDKVKTSDAQMTPKIRNALEDFYLPFNKRLKLLNITLEW